MYAPHDKSPASSNWWPHGIIFSVLISTIAVADEAPVQRLEFTKTDAWQFSGNPWQQRDDGIITPPNKGNLHSRAFFASHVYEDFTAEFEYTPEYRETGHGGAGLILRAKDPNHFYAVYFPWGGQSLSGKNYWASIVKVDGDAYLRSLSSAWVPGLPSETGRSCKVRVVVKGPLIEVWVNGRQAVRAIDDEYKVGLVGLMGYGWYSFRNVQIQGHPKPAPAWPERMELLSHSFTVGLSSSLQQSSCLAPNGDVLIASGNQLVRSRDSGRTWNAPETLPSFLGAVGDQDGFSSMFHSRDGRLLVQIFRRLGNRGSSEVPEILLSESKDNGATWSMPTPSKVEAPWPSQAQPLYPTGAMVQTEDGTMIRFVYGSLITEPGPNNGSTWRAGPPYKSYVTRSADGGKTWSGAIEIDQPAFEGKPRGTISGSHDLTESTGVEFGNQVMALVRPVYSPYMWQCWSSDGGRTWDSAARTTFPGYGGPCLLKTQNGMLVCSHRMPHFSINLSADGGLNWDQGTVVDYPVWAMGTMVEVEPNVLLCTYMNSQRHEPLLAQRIRIHRDRIEPLDPPRQP